MKLARTLLIALTVCAVLVTAGCPLLPRLVQALNPSVLYCVPEAGRTLFLTLDDGPSEATSAILAVLRKHQVHATFFVTTDHIQADSVKRIVSEGHQVANHLKTTTSLGKLTAVQFQDDFQAAERALSRFPHTKLFRPPGGAISDEQARFIMAQGYRIVLGTVYPFDHWLENENVIEALTKALVIDGGIVILHDTASRGPRSAAVLDRFVPWAKGRGYNFALLPGPVAEPATGRP